jgi:DNA-binding NarL/FixJ family response regulator
MPPTGTDEGIQAASWLREHRPEVGVVVLSQYKTPSYALALLETGSAGRAYLLKERVAGADELAQAIRTVAQSGSMIDPLIVDELIEAKSNRRKSDLSWLTPRGVGDPGRDGQGEEQRRHRHTCLQVSERAVEKHTNSIFSKLGLTEERDLNRRVKAVLVYLSDPGGGDTTRVMVCQHHGQLGRRHERMRPVSDRLPVLIVDDQAPFRAAMKAVLKRTTEFELVGEAANGSEAVALEESSVPALVLMDINMPEMNGIEATRTMVSRHPEVVVILCSTYDAGDLPPRWPRAGPAPTSTRSISAPTRSGDSGTGGTRRTSSRAERDSL